MNNFPIKSELSDMDKKSLLLIKEAIKELKGNFNYFEVGSYKGDTLVPFLADPYCKDIFSVDHRPSKVYDERGYEKIYIGNTTESMVKRLSKYCSAEQLKKLLCCEGTVNSTVTDAALIGEQKWFDLFMFKGNCSVDQLIEDFEVSWKTANETAVFIIHNSKLLKPAIEAIMKTAEKRHLIGYTLPENFFIIEKNCRIHLNADLYVHSMKNSHLSFTDTPEQQEAQNFYARFHKLRTLIKLLQGRNIFWL
jgi:hypothetical protein